MTGARLEVLVEPFRENDPGPHVVAAVGAMGDAGLNPDMGPFATTAEGDLDVVISTVSTLLRAAFDEGATSVQVRVDRVGRPGAVDDEAPDSRSA
ncbi:MAG: thiamine-binding protein [Acidimicrobiia bacterium]|nr:thiamine-binding protein [Acidimicrobiia bacterium]